MLQLCSPTDCNGRKINVGDTVECIDDSGRPVVLIPFHYGERMIVESTHYKTTEGHEPGHEIKVFGRWFLSCRFRVVDMGFLR